MKILFMFGFLPYPPNSGGIIRAYNLIKQLSRSHEIYLLVITPLQTKKEDTEKMLEYCKEVLLFPVWSEREAKFIMDTLLANKFRRFFYNLSPTLFFHPKIRNLLHPIYLNLYGLSFEALGALIDLQRREKFDLVHIEYLSLAHYVRYINGIPKVLGEQNIEYKVLEQVIRYQNYTPLDLLQKKILIKRLKRYETNIWRKFNRVITMSEKDKEHLEKLCKNVKISVIPNGVDLEYFKFQEEEEKYSGNKLIFTGSFQYQPNIDGINYFCREIFPLILRKLPDVNLLIVGRDPDSRVTHLQDNKNIKVIGNVDDIRPYIAQGSVYIVPLLSGSGTRLKILEAMAMGRAVVSTSIGCQGLRVTPRENIIIADKPQEFAQQTVSLLIDRNKRTELGKEGRKLVEDRYDWKGIVDKLEKVYEEVVREYTNKFK